MGDTAGTAKGKSGGRAVARSTGGSAGTTRGARAAAPGAPVTPRAGAAAVPGGGAFKIDDTEPKKESKKAEAPAKGEKVEVKVDKTGKVTIPSGSYAMAKQGTQFADEADKDGRAFTLAWPLGGDREEKTLPEEPSGELMSRIIAGGIVKV